MRTFNGFRQVILTLFFFAAILLLAIATVLENRALANLVPAVTGLANNLVKGVNEALGFERFVISGNTLTSSSKELLSQCGIMTPDINCLTPEIPIGTKSVNTLAEIKKINAAMESTLNKILKVANDKYLGLSQFKDIIQPIKDVQADMKNEETASQPEDCHKVQKVYCDVYKNGKAMVSQSNEVTQGVNKLTDDETAALARIGRIVDKLYFLPYVLWLSLFFYMFVFCGKNGTCKGSSWLRCGACCCHGLYYTLFFLISIAILVAGILVKRLLLQEEIGWETGKVKIGDMIFHIQREFPKFYSTVFQSIEAGLKDFHSSFIVFTIVNLMIAVHMFSACCFKVYYEEDKAQS